MIQVSNVDAERMCAGLEQWVAHCKKDFKTRSNVSIREINDVRRISVILKKINRKLNKECPDRHTIKNVKIQQKR